MNDFKDMKFYGKSPMLLTNCEKTLLKVDLMMLTSFELMKEKKVEVIKGIPLGDDSMTDFLGDVRFSLVQSMLNIHDSENVIEKMEKSIYSFRSFIMNINEHENKKNGLDLLKDFSLN